MSKERPDRDFYRRVWDLIEELRPTLPKPGDFRAEQAATVWRIVKVALVVLCAATVLIYVGDYATARVRLSRSSALATVNVARMVAIPQKSGKTEFEYVGAEAVSCVRSIFPHFGYVPCWWASRNTIKLQAEILQRHTFALHRDFIPSSARELLFACSATTIPNELTDPASSPCGRAASGACG